MLWPGKCLGFGFPGLRAMANELLLLFHSLSPSPKAGFDPGVLCWGWHGFLTDEQKEQLCLLLWLWSLLVLLFLQHVSCCRPGRGVTLFAASKDVTITPTSMALRATCLSPASSKQTLVHPQRHRHKHTRSLSPPSCTPTPTHRISIKAPSVYTWTHIHKRSTT